jgi:thiol-disulfide isomerase/thioredoxin
MNHFFKQILFLSFTVTALACSQTKAPTGKATLTGRFSGSFPVGQIYTVKVVVPAMIVTNPMEQFTEYETQLEPDGSFSLSIPLFCPVLALFSMNEEALGAVSLSPDKETKIELSLGKPDSFQVKMIEDQGLTTDDIDKINKPVMEFLQKVMDSNNLSGLQYDMSPKEYRDYILNWTKKEIDTIIVNDTDSLSKNKKQILTTTLKWVTSNGLLFNYEGQVRYLYEKQRNEKGVSDTVFKLIKPDKSYYSFLRFFDFNNPPFGNPTFYSNMYKKILADSILNIPSISSQSLADWLKVVKTNIAELVGLDSGLFYDLLVTHAYMKQFEELKPLSDDQKKGIEAYFKNPTFAKFLFTENDAVIKQSKSSSIVKDTPKVEKEKLMDAIVSQYKGKVVVVDFWATWCAPCLQAMKEIKPLKEEMQGRNIVFLYIAEPSSPVDLWKTKILGIDGEHYYLSKEESEFISNHFKIESIPTYQIYDSTGILKNQIEGFPGINEMRTTIEKMLPLP